MKLLFVLFIFVVKNVTGQNKLISKASIDTSSFNKWPYVTGAKISNNGKYIAYTIANMPLGNSTLKVVDTSCKLNIEIPSATANQGYFTDDGNLFLFKNRFDSLFIIDLLKKNISYVATVSSFKFLRSRSDELILYKLNSSDTLFLKNISTSVETKFENVMQYWIFNDNILLLKNDSNVGKDEKQALLYINLENLKTKSLFTGAEIRNIIFDNSNKSVAFIVESIIDKSIFRTICYYKVGLDTVVKVLKDGVGEFGQKFRLDKLLRFNNSNTGVFFVMKRMENKKPNASYVNLNIWSYSDPKLQSVQLADLYNLKSHESSFMFIIRFNDQKAIRLEQDNDISALTNFPQKNDDILLVTNRKGDFNEYNWNKESLNSYSLVSVITGERKSISGNIAMVNPILSPNGRFLIFYNYKEGNYYSHEILTGRVRNLTGLLKGRWTVRNDEPRSAYTPIGVAAFVKEDSSVLIYDQNDIFQINLLNETNPINLTNGYGRKSNIVFRLSLPQNIVGYSNDQKIILRAFDLTKKYDGFYQTEVGKQGNPILLSMQPYMISGVEDDSDFGVNSPLKAKDNLVYLIKRMSASESPNYFYTSDFRTFKSISNVQPEKLYNWMTSELVTWKGTDGRKCQGVLYKPENFNSSIKYPIIFHFYERYSNGLRGFIMPGPCYGPLNIPYFVSNGYLVFVPDINFKMGYPGRSAYETVLSAAEFLSKKSWIDSTRMGLQGHSFGGFQVSYIITYTSKFSAACASSPMTNFISAYGSIIGNGSSRQKQYELYRDRIGKSLWAGTDLYIKNSPVLRANKVQTPLLMMTNDKDSDVPWQQGIEYFTALRRLEKVVWMLQYEGEEHILLENSNELDFTIRMKQFFDHYLMTEPAPGWMTKGVSADMKGVYTGYELDPLGRCSKGCMICKRMNITKNVSTNVNKRFHKN